VPVGTGTRAAASGLDPEQIVQHSHHEVVVQVAATGCTDDQGHDREPLGLEVAEYLDRRFGPPRLDGTLCQRLLTGSDHVDAHSLLQLEDQTGTNGLDDCRAAAFLALDGVAKVPVFPWVDVLNGAAAWNIRDSVAQQRLPHHQHAGRARATDELVRAEEDSVLVRRGVPSLCRHVIAVDEPIIDGGDDTAQTQTILFVAGLASCVGFYQCRYLTRPAKHDHRGGDISGDHGLTRQFDRSGSRTATVGSARAIRPDLGGPTTPP
jgi:hypothetical protein